MNRFMLGRILSGFHYKVSEDDEWEYFFVGDGSGKLYRIRKDGMAFEQVINTSCCEVNIVGDWIYHCRCGIGETLHKIRKDGTELTKLNDDYTREVNVVGDWIYYCTDGMNLYKIRTDGTEKTKLNDDVCSSVRVIGDWVYYGVLKNYHGVMVDEECDEIYRINVDGTKRTRLCDKKTEWFEINGEWIFYYPTKGCTLFKMRVDGTGSSKLIEGYRGKYLQSGNGQHQAEGDWVYYTLKEDSLLCKVRCDGTEKLVLAEQCRLFRVEEDWIYYILTKRDTNALYKVRTDGTYNTKIADINSEYGFTIHDDWIYYSKKDGIFKIQKDSSTEIKLNNDIIDDYFGLNIIGDWIYYENDSETGAIYRMRDDGTEREWLADVQGVVLMEEDWIYYVNESDHNKLYRIRPDGTQRAKISDGEFERFWVIGDWICFLVPENERTNTNSKPRHSRGIISIKPSKLYRMRIDGTRTEKICDDVIEYAYLIDGWLHYTNLDDEKKYKIKADGTRCIVDEK